jgi:hypothetical protein
MALLGSTTPGGVLTAKIHRAEMGKNLGYSSGVYRVLEQLEVIQTPGFTNSVDVKTGIAIGSGYIVENSAIESVAINFANGTKYLTIRIDASQLPVNACTFQWVDEINLQSDNLIDLSVTGFHDIPLAKVTAVAGDITLVEDVREFGVGKSFVDVTGNISIGEGGDVSLNTSLQDIKTLIGFKTLGNNEKIATTFYINDGEFLHKIASETSYLSSTGHFQTFHTRVSKVDDFTFNIVENKFINHLSGSNHGTVGIGVNFNSFYALLK